MVADTLKNFALYESLNKGFPAAGEFLRAFEKEPKPDGQYQLGNGVRANVSSYDTQPAQGRFYEAHKQYIDIQCVVRGAEKIGYALTETLTVTTPFKEGGDIAFFDGEGKAWHTLKAWDFLILWPQDAHLPCTMIDSPAPVTKIVIKVPVE